MAVLLRELVQFQGKEVKNAWGRTYKADVFKVNPDFPYSQLAENRHLRVPSNLTKIGQVTTTAFRAIEKSLGGADVFADTEVSGDPATKNWLQRVSVYGAIALNQEVLEPQGLRIATPWEVQEILAAKVLPIPEEIIFLHSLLLDATVKTIWDTGFPGVPYTTDHAPELLSAIFNELNGNDRARIELAKLFLIKETHGLMVRVDRVAAIKRAMRGRSGADAEHFAEMYELVTRPLNSLQIEQITEASTSLRRILKYLSLGSPDSLLQRLSLPLHSLRLVANPTNKSRLDIELAQGWFCDADNAYPVNEDVARRLKIPMTHYERLALQAVDLNIHRGGSHQNGTDIPTNAPYSRGLIIVEK
ncbi:MAG: hypothetical protein WCT31_05365 [Candidatus Micrarchaeia archaeon]|jgi:hypothetical protein